MDLTVELLGTRFSNPVLLAAGTCGFGREVANVIDLAKLGGIVTKSVTLEPRAGNPAPRVAELATGMVNSVGLANPGARAVRDEILPWIADHLEVPVVVSVAGHRVEEYVRIVEVLDGGPGFVAYELNLSCPNDAARSGLPFALDPEATLEIVQRVRGLTDRPIVAKLAPNTPDLEPVIRSCERGGADALTLVNTMPGLVLDPASGKPALGAGQGGVSGPALRAIGVRAVWLASGLTDLPLIGVGGISAAEDAVQYLRAGATLVQIGSASFWDPRSAGRVVQGLESFGRSIGLARVTELVGTARGPRDATASPSVARDEREGAGPPPMEQAAHG